MRGMELDGEHHMVEDVGWNPRVQAQVVDSLHALGPMSGVDPVVGPPDVVPRGGEDDRLELGRSQIGRGGNGTGVDEHTPSM